MNKGRTMQDGDEISFDTSLEKTVTLRRDTARNTTRVDQEYWIKITFPDGRYIRYDLGTGTYVLDGIYEDEAELAGARANKKIAGMSYPEAIGKAHEVMQSIPPGLRLDTPRFKSWLAEWKLIDPSKAKKSRKRLPPPEAN